MREYKNIKIFLQLFTLQIDWKRFLLLKKVKNIAPRTYVISDVKGEKIVQFLYVKELKKTNQTKFRIDKVIKQKGDKVYVK